MQKIHFRTVLKLGNKKRYCPLCGKYINELKTTTDKKEVTCNMCKLILRGKK